MECTEEDGIREMGIDRTISSAWVSMRLALIVSEPINAKVMSQLSLVQPRSVESERDNEAKDLGILVAQVESN